MRTVVGNSTVTSAIEASFRVGARIKEYEESVHTGGFKDRSRFRRNPGKPDIAIALHGFFKATQQQVKRICVQSAQVGTVDHETRAINVKARG